MYESYWLSNGQLCELLRIEVGDPKYQITTNYPQNTLIYRLAMNNIKIK